MTERGEKAVDGYDRMYGLLRQTAREERGSSLRLRRGRVVSTAPLQVNVGGQEQEADRFVQMVNVASGDSVLLLTEDDQTFYLIGRVVSG